MKNFMCILISLIIIQNAFSQESKRDSCSNTQERPWVLLLRYSNDFSFDSFEGANISLQKRINENEAIRLGLTIGGNDNDDTRYSILPTGVNLEIQNRQTDYINFIVHTKYVYNLITHENINLYIGSGPFYNYYISNIETKDNFYDVDSLTNTRTNKSENRRDEFGLELIAGIEWLVTPYLSFLAEYGTYFAYNSGTNKTSTKNSDPSSNIINSKNESDGYSINDIPIKIGIAFKF